MIGNTKKSEPIQLDVKLHRSNMQVFLRATEAKLGTLYPKECIVFLRTNDVRFSLYDTSNSESVLR